jgi:hypothetical protein
MVGERCQRSDQGVGGGDVTLWVGGMRAGGFEP